jgi:erythritol kinase
MILGIDPGTSVVKAAAFSADGEVLEVEGRQVKLYNPRPECSEQDIDETLEALGEVVRAVVERTDEPVEAVGLTGQGTICGSWTSGTGRSGAPRPGSTRGRTPW